MIAIFLYHQHHHHRCHCYRHRFHHHHHHHHHHRYRHPHHHCHHGHHHDHHRCHHHDNKCITASPLRVTKVQCVGRFGFRVEARLEFVSRLFRVYGLRIEVPVSTTCTTVCVCVHTYIYIYMYGRGYIYIYIYICYFICYLFGATPPPPTMTHLPVWYVYTTGARLQNFIIGAGDRRFACFLVLLAKKHV